ncbi:MAG TPA: BTAD domain-containing putative transcriptional regulator [Anaerolineaceae bacterium]|nr:BTAD domain-containing putative transcriptional regulator [Anaerolineaceae bacterium]
MSRQRVTQTLLDNITYPLLIIQAGTGYGKSTELVTLTGEINHFYWYSIQESDRDPFLFLAKLFSSFSKRERNTSDHVLDLMESDQRYLFPELLTIFINELSKNLFEDTYLILDDFHHVLDQPEIEQIVTLLVDNSPANFHLIISTRQLPNFKMMNKWRVKGQMKIITRHDLAFTKGEIISLFQDKFKIILSEQQAELLLNETEGWVIALQIIWQSIQRGNITIEQVFLQRPITLEALFEYLASEVLSQLPTEIQKFLLTTSVLNIIELDISNVLMGVEKSEDFLHYVKDHGLFITSLGKKNYQYQNLFHDLLKTQLRKDPDEFLLLNKKCSDYFLDKGRLESAIYHLLEANYFEEAKIHIIEIAPNLINFGRLDTLLSWLGRLPMSLTIESAEVQMILGEIKRLKSDFEGSLTHFQKAFEIYSNLNVKIGISKALRGQSQIYLDTIRPLKAEALLQEALKILEPQEFKKETADLLDQLAENKLNLGHPDQAQALHHEARLLRDEDDPGIFYLEARSALRTGHLDEGRALLEEQLSTEKSNEEKRPQRFHRETSLLLSLICIFQGDWEAAKENALNGISIGQQLNSSFVESVGYIRLGHAYEIQGIVHHQQNLLEKAIDCYHLAIDKVRIFKVTRVQVEPLWALSRSFGFQGNILEATRYAKEAMMISEQAGDKWLFNLVQLSLGSSHFYTGMIKESQDYFTNAIEGFKQVSDSFGLAAALMWKMVAHWYDGETDVALNILRQLIPLIKAGNYIHLFTKPTYLGLKDEQIIIPILLNGYQQNIDRSFIETILMKFNLEIVDHHPGYSIFVHSLGVFEVWRGENRIRSVEWQRDKARKLFQLLLIYRHEWLHRDQIIDRLWPDLPQDAAIRDFKVALNALNKALEPTRPKGVNPFFIVRNENLYHINSQAKIWWDVEHFEELAEKNDLDSLEEALSMYRGEFLTDNLYEEWANNKREQLKQTVIMVIEKLSNLYLEDGDFDQVIRVSELLLKVDPSWEPAYRNLMLGYAGKENQAQIIAVYQRMKKVLSEELGANPSDTTEKLFISLKK